MRQGRRELAEHRDPTRVRQLAAEFGSIFLCLSLLPIAACVGIPSAERLQLGYFVTRTKVNFEDLYAPQPPGSEFDSESVSFVGVGESDGWPDPSGLGWELPSSM